MRSVKSMPNPNQIFDNFTLTCPEPPQRGKIYPNDLSFNITSTRGYFEGHWPLTEVISKFFFNIMIMSYL